MSGVFPRRKIAALRLNSSVVKWYEKAGGLRKDKLPVAAGDRFVGLVMLFSTETGEPLAIFPDGYVQKLRVAAATAIAARYLARRDSQVMALLGSGWQASAHLVTLCMVRGLHEVKVYSPTPESRQRFVVELGETVAAKVQEATSVREAIDGADIITAQPIPYHRCFPENYCGRVSMFPASSRANLMRRPIVAPIPWSSIGVKPNLSRSQLGVDPQSIPDISNGWLHPLTREVLPFWDLPTLSELVNGQHPGKTRDDAISCFCNNVGLGLQFAALGSEVLERARRAEVGREIPTDWFLESVHP